MKPTNPPSAKAIARAIATTQAALAKFDAAEANVRELATLTSAKAEVVLQAAISALRMEPTDFDHAYKSTRLALAYIDSVRILICKGEVMLFTNNAGTEPRHESARGES